MSPSVYLNKERTIPRQVYRVFNILCVVWDQVSLLELFDVFTFGRGASFPCFELLDFFNVDLHDSHLISANRFS